MEENTKKPLPLWVKGTFILLAILAVIFISIELNSLFNSKNPTAPDVCMTISPSYLMDCMVNGTHIQAQALTDEQMKAAEQKYGCTVNTTYQNFNIDYCSAPGNLTKYKISLSPVSS